MFRQIESKGVLDTIGRLERRIGERFSEAGLRRIAQELYQIAEDSVERVRIIGEPIRILRLLVFALLTCVLAVLAYVPFLLGSVGRIETTLDFVQVLEPAQGAMFFIGAFAVSLLTVEQRVKRNRALRAIHELRALAHIVDMHQLTKDPERASLGGPRTPSSPERTLTPFELNRYYDYCSEMLSLISKLAALYIQDFHDRAAIDAVDGVESLTSGLSRKIWQKIMVLSRG